MAISSAAEHTRATLLIRLNQAGPEREIAWVEFHDLYAPMIGCFARRMGARSHEVEDLVQDVLGAFFCRTPEFQYDPAKGRFRGYLKTCVWNKMAKLRRRAAIEAEGIGRLQPGDPDPLAIDTIWNDVWEIEKLGRALATVRQQYAGNAERQRTFRAFELCTLLDRSATEVAVDLGLSTESVRAAKSRVSKALRQAFDRLDEVIG